MAREKRLSLTITGDAKKAQKALADLDAAAGKHGKSTEKALSGVKGQLAGLGAIAFAGVALNEFDEAQKVAKQTEAVIASTGGAANVTADDIGNLASELSKKAAIDDDVIQSGENVIATFTGIRNEAGEGRDIFNQATQAALDMSVAMGTDMNSAALLVGKALNDPIAGLSKLTKAGVVFTQQQKDQIKAMAEAGDVAGAQKLMLDELNKEFGGSAEAQATAMGRTKVALGELAETVGGVLAPAVEGLVNVLEPAVGWFSELDGWQQKLIVGAGGAVVAYAKWGDSIGSAAGRAEHLWKALNASAQANNLTRPKAAVEGLKGALSQSVTEAGKFETAMAGAAAGVTAFGGTLSLLNEMSDFDGDVQGLAKDLGYMADGIGDSDQALQELGVNTEDLADAFKKAFGNSGYLDRGIGLLSGGIVGDTPKEINDAQNKINALDDALAAMVSNGNIKGAETAFAQLKEELIAQGVSATDVDGYLDSYAKELDRAKREGILAKKDGVDPLTGGFDDQADSAEKVKTGLEKVTDYLDRVRDRADAARDAIKGYYDATTATVTSQMDVEAALIDLDDALDRNGQALSIAGKAGQENRQAMIEARDAAVDYALQLGKTEGPQAAVDAMESYRLKLIDTLTQAGFTEGQVASLIDEMGLTPAEVNTVFYANTDEAEAKIAALRQSIYNAAADILGLGGIPVADSTVGAPSGPFGIGNGGGGGGSAPFGLGNSIKPALPIPPAGGVGGGGRGVGNGAPPVSIVVQGSVLTDRELVDIVADGLNKAARANGGRSILVGI